MVAAAATDCGASHRDIETIDGLTFCVSCGEVVESIAGYSFHSRLEHEDEIRILKLDAGQGHQQLSGELVHYTLTEDPIYEAVSYTWATRDGEAALSRSLRLRTPEGQKLLSITRNCENALRRFRRPSVSRYLWIDSVCINQFNDQERSSQVLLMADIYSKAQRVVVYLEEVGHFDERQIFSLFGSLGLHLPQAPEQSASMTRFVSDYPESSKPVRGAVQEMGLTNSLDSHPQEPDVGSATVDTLLENRLFLCRWFHRIWVLQEIAMAKEAVVFLGSQSIPWGFISRQHLEHTGISKSGHLQDLRSLCQHEKVPPVVLLGKQLPWNSMNLTELLLATRSCGASDPRDKIFALLRLANDASLPDPDYSLAPEEIFKMTTIHCIYRWGLEILTLVNPNKLEQCPSWVPNLGSPSTLTRIDAFVKRWRQLKSPSLGSSIAGQLPDRPYEYAAAIANFSIQHIPVRGFQLDHVVRTQDASQSEPVDQSSSFWPWMYRHGHSKPEIGTNTGIAIDGESICIGLIEEFTALREALGEGRTVLQTANFLGIGPPDAMKGDVVFAIDGLESHLLLRPHDDYYRVVGECLLHLPPLTPSTTSARFERFCKCFIPYGCFCSVCTAYASWNAIDRVRAEEIMLA